MGPQDTAMMVVLTNVLNVTSHFSPNEGIATGPIQKTKIQLSVFDPHDQIIVLWVYGPCLTFQCRDFSSDFSVEANDDR